MNSSNQTIALKFPDDSDSVAGMPRHDEEEEEMLKKAIAMSLEEQ